MHRFLFSMGPIMSHVSGVSGSPIVVLVQMPPAPEHIKWSCKQLGRVDLGLQPSGPVLNAAFG